MPEIPLHRPRIEIHPSGLQAFVCGRTVRIKAADLEQFDAAFTRGRGLRKVEAWE